MVPPDACLSTFPAFSVSSPTSLDHFCFRVLVCICFLFSPGFLAILLRYPSILIFCFPIELIFARSLVFLVLAIVVVPLGRHDLCHGLSLYYSYSYVYHPTTLLFFPFPSGFSTSHERHTTTTPNFPTIRKEETSQVVCPFWHLKNLICLFIECHFFPSP